MPVQITDIHKTMPGDLGIQYQGPGVIIWTVEPGVTVASDLANAVNSLQSNSTLINHGAIAAGAFMSYGVQFTGTNTGAILNCEDGSISGYYGVGVDGFYIGITNFGSIVASKYGVAFNPAAVGCSLDNRSDIYSDEFAVVDTSNTSGSVISNRGNIEGRFVGVGFATAPGLITHVANSGIIAGGTHAISGAGVGALDLLNSGTIVGDILLTAADKDTLINAGTISGNVHLGGGDDTFTGIGGRSGAIFGDGGADKLTGGAQKDTIFGDDGTDTLRGGLGADALNGGAGNDKFVFDTTLGAMNRDTISDFVHLHDKFQLENAIFKAVGADGALNAAYFWSGAAAHDANDHVIYNHATGALFYDSDGTGAHAQIQFATLTSKPVLTASDFAII